jgi:hypothetical protein
MLAAATGLALWMASAGVDLSTLFRASERPEVCRDSSAGGPASERAESPWLDVRSGSLRQLCHQLARAQIELSSRPQAALSIAVELATAWPARPEPLVVQARALLRLQRSVEAWALWQRALQAGYRLRAPGSLRDHALTAVLTGHRQIALADYRQLATLVALWPSATERRRLYLEAAGAALASGPDHLGEAATYLGEARRGAASVRLHAFVAGMTALVHFHRGEPSSSLSQVDSAEAWLFVEKTRSARHPEHWPLVGVEALAAASLLIEPFSAAEALDLWQPYLERLERDAVGSPWLAQARARAARLEKEAQ